jgi:hypothetical protein
MLGRDGAVVDARTQALHDLLAKQPGFHEKSWNSFAAAIKVGTDRLIQETPKLSGQVPATMDYGVISIESARSIGVRPIPYTVAVEGSPATPTTAPPTRILRPIR